MHLYLAYTLGTISVVAFAIMTIAPLFIENIYE